MEGHSVHRSGPFTTWEWAIPYVGEDLLSPHEAKHTGCAKEEWTLTTPGSLPW